FADFENVIPAPDDPEYRDGPLLEVAKESFKWWYRWNINIWGRKWNSFACQRYALYVFIFETAWSPVSKIIARISKDFPDVRIKYTWADENTVHNCGRAVDRNGLLEYDAPNGGSVDAYQIAFESRPEYAENYELIDGTFKYKES